MCIYDDYYDWYYEEWGLGPLRPGFSPCTCGFPLELGDRVFWMVGSEVDWDKPCVVARRSVLEPRWALEDEEHECCHCTDGFYTVWHRDVLCVRCKAAAALLDKWCDGHYAWGGIPQQLVDHWWEDRLYQSHPFSILVAAARRNWINSSGTPVPVEQIKDLVRLSIEAVKQPAATERTDETA